MTSATTELTSPSCALNTADLFHTGIIVSDLQSERARLTTVAGYRWTKVLEFSIPVVDGGVQRTVDFAFSYSVQAPHLELVQQIPGTLWMPSVDGAVHHLGYFVDDVEFSSAALQEAGFRRESYAVSDGASSPAFAYLRDVNGTRVEIVDRSLLGDWPTFLRANQE